MLKTGKGFPQILHFVMLRFFGSIKEKIPNTSNGYESITHFLSIKLWVASGFEMLKT